MTNSTTPELLSDEQIAEIEEHARKAPNGAEGWRVPALCQTVRALEAALHKANEVVEEGIRANAALRDQLAQVEKERNDLRDQIDHARDFGWHRSRP